MKRTEAVKLLEQYFLHYRSWSADASDLLEYIENTIKMRPPPSPIRFVDGNNANEINESWEFEG